MKWTSTRNRVTHANGYLREPPALCGKVPTYDIPLKIADERGGVTCKVCLRIMAKRRAA